MVVPAHRAGRKAAGNQMRAAWCRVCHWIPRSLSASRHSKNFRADRDPLHNSVIPAQAGIHRSAAETAEAWVPAFAGTTIKGQPNQPSGGSGALDGFEKKIDDGGSEIRS